MPTIWKDHPDEIIFVPVWDFFGSETTTFDKNAKEKGDLYESLDENYQRTDDLGCQSILTHQRDGRDDNAADIGRRLKWAGMKLQSDYIPMNTCLRAG